MEWWEDNFNEPNTPTQRQALYKMGRSRWWVKKFATTKEQAAEAIEKEITHIKEGMEHNNKK